MLKINGYITFCTYNSMISEVSKYKHHHNNIIYTIIYMELSLKIKMDNEAYWCMNDVASPHKV